MGGIICPLLLLTCFAMLAESWKCAKGGACDCYSDMWVRCTNINTAPLFKMSVRRSRNLLITVTPDDEFQMDSLHVTDGFNYVGVIVYDMEMDYCSRVTNEFPWVKCFARTTENDDEKSTETTEDLTSKINEEKSTDAKKTDELTTHEKPQTTMTDETMMPDEMTTDRETSERTAEREITTDRERTTESEMTTDHERSETTTERKMTAGETTRNWKSPTENRKMTKDWENTQKSEDVQSTFDYSRPTENVNTTASVIEQLKMELGDLFRQPLVIALCVITAVGITLMLTVTYFVISYRKTRYDHNPSCAVKCFRCICCVVMAPCNCLDSLRDRQRVNNYYVRYGAGTSLGSMESVEIYPGDRNGANN